MYKLKQIDRDILYTLDHDSRQSIAEVARELHLGRERSQYRIKRLTERGVIKSFTTSVNPYKFGLVIYKTYIQLEHNRKKIARFVEHLDAHPRVYWYAECEGTWDLMFAVFGKSPKEFHTIQSAILSKFSDIIVNFSVYTIVEALFFRKNYLRGIGTGSFPFGGEPEHHELTEIDFNILRLLSEDSRLTAVDIGQRLKTTPSIVRGRIEKLEKLGIIVGYRIELNLKEIGMMYLKAQVHLRTYDARVEEMLREYCKMNPHIILIIQQIGDCKIELEFEVFSREQYNEFIDDIRERFSKYIRRIDTITMKYERYKWMPYDIVKEGL